MPFGGALQNFGMCALDEAGNATLTLHEASTGKVLYELRADARQGGVRISQIGEGCVGVE